MNLISKNGLFQKALDSEQPKDFLIDYVECPLELSKYPEGKILEEAISNIANLINQGYSSPGFEMMSEVLVALECVYASYFKRDSKGNWINKLQ